MNTRKMRPWIVVLALGLLVFACQRDVYQPNKLRKMTKEEVLYFHQQKLSLSPYVVFKEVDGTPLKEETRERLNRGELTRDYYVDEEGEVMEIVVREVQTEDDIWDALNQSAKRTTDDFEPVAVNCRDQRKLLRQIYKRYRDQDFQPKTRRLFGSAFEMNFESRQVLSLLFACGFPTKAEVGEAGLMGLYYSMIDQQSGWIATFYPNFKRSVELGELPPKYLAYIEDLVLALNRKAQIYGTYHGWNYQINEVGLTPIRDSSHVDERRLGVGLEPLAVQEEEYQAVRDSLEQVEEEPRILFDRTSFGQQLDSLMLKRAKEATEKTPG